MYRLNTKIRLTMLCLSDFELYSRWVPLIDCSLDTDVDQISNEAGSSPTQLPFSSVVFIVLFTTLIYKNPIMYFER